MKKLWYVVSFVLVAAMVLSACGPQEAPATPAADEVAEAIGNELDKVLARTQVAEMTPVAKQQVVVTATGMVDLGPLLNADEIPAKSETNPVIEWDQYHQSEKWEEKPCLFDASVMCYYAQTSVDGSFNLSDFGEMPFTVPNNWSMVSGTYAGTLKLESGFHKSHSGGFLFALSPNTKIHVLALTDGFMKLVPTEHAREEYCAALQQAVDHDWARQFNYGDDAWGDDPCDGIAVVVPLDSDRIPAASNDDVMPTPTYVP